MTEKLMAKAKDMQKLVLDNWIVAGGTGVGILCILISVLAFNDESYYKENKVSVEFVSSVLFISSRNVASF